MNTLNKFWPMMKLSNIFVKATPTCRIFKSWSIPNENGNIYREKIEINSNTIKYGQFCVDYIKHAISIDMTTRCLFWYVRVFLISLVYAKFFSVFFWLKCCILKIYSKHHMIDWWFQIKKIIKRCSTRKTLVHYFYLHSSSDKFSCWVISTSIL